MKLPVDLSAVKSALDSTQKSAEESAIGQSLHRRGLAPMM